MDVVPTSGGGGRGGGGGRREGPNVLSSGRNWGNRAFQRATREGRRGTRSPVLNASTCVATTVVGRAVFLATSFI